MKNFSALKILPFLVVAFLVLPPARAAEQNEKGNNAEAEQQKDKQASLEAHIKELEKRVKELEEAQEERAAPPTPPAPPALPHFQRPRQFDTDMDELWDRFRRDLESEFQMELPNGALNARPGFIQRPRLGVELAPPSEDLSEKYKNSVKEGAFITKVVPGSPAAKAGLNVGDAITSIGGTAIKSPQDAIAAVRSAPAGKTEIVVSRSGAPLVLSADLSASDELVGEARLQESPRPSNKWLRRGQGNVDETAGTRSSTEVKASALELTSQLADELKLNDKQKNKMSDVLAKEAKALTEEATASLQAHSRRGFWGYNLNMNADINRLVEKHARNAEKDLSGVLSAEQLQKWSAYRQEHNSVSMTQSMTVNGADNAPMEDMGF